MSDGWQPIDVEVTCSACQTKWIVRAMFKGDSRDFDLPKLGNCPSCNPHIPFDDIL